MVIKSNTQKISPEDLNRLANDLGEMRQRAVVQKHPELLRPIEAAEQWAREKYRSVREGRIAPPPEKT